MDIEERLNELGIVMPPPPTAIGNFAPGIVFDNILYVSGTYGTVKDGSGSDHIPKAGKLGGDLQSVYGFDDAAEQLIVILERLDRPDLAIQI